MINYKYKLYYKYNACAVCVCHCVSMCLCLYLYQCMYVGNAVVNAIGVIVIVTIVQLIVK